MSEPAHPPQLLSPGQVLSFADTQLNALFLSVGKMGVLGVVGVLGPVRESRYPVHYGVELRDGNDVLLLNIPKTLQPSGLTGRQVEVFGCLQATKNLQLALSVSQLRPVVDVAPQVLEEERSLREVFQRPTAGEDSFPPAGDLWISVLHGISSSVLADFMGQIEDMAFDVEEIPVKLQDPASIIAGIKKACGGVLVIIRGGGNDGEFEVFNRPDVLEAWRDKDAYKISALGHTQNLTLLDRISHKSCETPTAAGRFIRSQADLQYTQAYWKERAEQAGKETGLAVERATSPLLQQNTALTVQADTLRVEAERLRAQLAAPARPVPVFARRAVWIAIAAAAIIGLVVGLVVR